MPVIGKIHARPRSNTVAKLQVGQTGFINSENILVLKDRIMIHKDISVYLLMEEESVEQFLESFFEFIPIKRIGNGLTEDDFEINISGLDETENDFILETLTEYIQMIIDHEEEYIVFTNVDISIELRPSRKKELSIEELESQLEEAVEQEDWQKAAELRNKIQEKRDKK
jgi:hypothetical protein